MFSRRLQSRTSPIGDLNPLHGSCKSHAKRRTDIDVGSPHAELRNQLLCGPFMILSSRFPSLLHDRSVYRAASHDYPPSFAAGCYSRAVCTLCSFVRSQVRWTLLARLLVDSRMRIFTSYTPCADAVAARRLLSKNGYNSESSGSQARQSI